MLSKRWVGMAVLVGLAAVLAAAQTNADPAYVTGYNDGYTYGQQDHDASAVANPHKFRVYQDATDGYTPGYGTPQAYRTSFQSGFDDGYGDGYNGRSRSVGATPAPPPVTPPGAPAPPLPPGAAPAPPAPDAAQVARANGYREGYNTGQSDANTHVAYNATASGEYKAAQMGYDPTLGAIADYQQAFQSGFASGYDDGFYHRLYNSSIGARTPPADAPAPANPAAGLVVPANTNIYTRLEHELDTKNSYVGEAFSLTVTTPIWVGAVAAIPAGSTIQGTVEKVERGGHFSGHAQIQLQYNTLTLPGQTPVSFNATTIGTGNATQNVNGNEGTVNGQNANTGTHAAKDATVGAVLGGIFGGTGGLIRGATAGAAIGTAGVLMSHNRDLTLRVGEGLIVQLDQPLTIPRS